MFSKDGFYCEIRLNGEFHFETTNLWNKTTFIIPEHFKNDESLLFSEKYSDVVFLVENEKIPAHKAIITSRCEYFATMMSSGLKESNQNEIQLSVPLKAFKTILEYIYTGNFVTKTEEETLQAIELSKIYLLTHLQDSVEKLLEANISFENVFKTMELETVCENCFKFIDDNFTIIRSNGRNDSGIVGICPQLKTTKSSTKKSICSDQRIDRDFWNRIYFGNWILQRTVELDFVEWLWSTGTKDSKSVRENQIEQNET